MAMEIFHENAETQKKSFKESLLGIELSSTVVRSSFQALQGIEIGNKLLADILLIVAELINEHV